MDWHRLDGSVIRVPPFMVLPKRPMGCQFINTHNIALSEILNCNSNVQIGDSSHVYYSTLYTSKSTQKEDSEVQYCIGHAIIKRLRRVQLEAQQNETGNQTVLVLERA